jgi:hypothetical protein
MVIILFQDIILLILITIALLALWLYEKFMKPRMVGNAIHQQTLWLILQTIIDGNENYFGIPPIKSLPLNGEWYNHEITQTLYYRFKIIKLPIATRNSPQVCNQLRILCNQQRITVCQSTAFQTPFVDSNTFYITTLWDNSNEYVFDIIPVSKNNVDSIQMVNNQFNFDNMPISPPTAPPTSGDVKDEDF